MGAFSLDFGQKCDFQFSKINRIVECSVGATCGKTIRSKVIKGKKADCQLLNLFRISELECSIRSMMLLENQLLIIAGKDLSKRRIRIRVRPILGAGTALFSGH